MRLLLGNMWQLWKNKLWGARHLKWGAINLTQPIVQVVNKAHIDVSEIFHLFLNGREELLNLFLP